MLCVSMAHAEAQLASLDFVKTPENAKVAALPSSVRPSATMSSTSAFLDPKSVSVPEAHSSYNWRAGATGASQMMSFSPLATSSTKQKYTRSASFGTAGMSGTQLPAMAISNSNYSQLASGGASFGASSIPQPRKSERDDPDNPADPPGMDTPVGDYPILLMIALLSLYILIFRKDKMSAKALFCRTK